jgi:hypothetical protein
VAGGPREPALVAGGSSIGHSDRLAKTGTRKMRTMIKRSTKMMRERMKMKSTIVKIIEDDI